MNRRMFLAFLLAALSTGASAQDADPLRIVATVPDLGALARRVGGGEVEVVVLCKPSEDPHFVETRPSFIREASRAHAWIQVGMDLEIGYAPLILGGSRNGRIRPGQPGFIDASTVVGPLGVPAGPVDRSMGDVHAAGSPHYLLDPVNGVKVADLIRARLSAIRPASAEAFRARFEAFKAEAGRKLAGEALAAKYDVMKLAILQDAGTLEEFLEKQGDLKVLGGWWAQLAACRGCRVACDHDIWSYFCRRFGLSVAGTMEPKPGVAPTTKHLGELAARMREKGVKAVLTSPYFDPRHADALAERTGARVVPSAHQVGAREGTDDYLSMIAYNVRRVAEAVR